MFRKKSSEGGEGTTIFYATDMHGSTPCFKKFINAAVYYNSKGQHIDVVIMGGDVAGKLIVPIIHEGLHHKSYLTGMNWDMTTDDELAAFKKNCNTLGVYPVIFEPDEYEAFAGDPALQDERFHQVVVDRLREWVEFAEDRLEGQPIRCFLSPGNDDFWELDDVLRSSTKLIVPDGEVVRVDDEHEMLSSGFSNITPFNCPRDIPEEELLNRLEALASGIEDMSKAIFNTHVPPYNSQLDNAPKLDENLQPEIGPGGVETAPAGSRAVRQLIEKHQPLLGLHGHIHESKAAKTIGRTLCLNPGSEYSEGILRGLIVTIAGDKVLKHMFTSG